MAITREELKKLIVEEMIKQQTLDEGVRDWLKAQASRGLGVVGSAATKASEKIAPQDPKFLQDLSKVADFIQYYRRIDTIKKSRLYRKLESDKLQEVYESDILKLMRDKKINQQDLIDFVDDISKNEQLKSELDKLELHTKGTTSSKSIPPEIGSKEQTPDTKPQTPEEKSPDTASEKAPEPVSEPVPGTKIVTQSAQIELFPSEQNVPAGETPESAAIKKADRIKELVQKHRDGYELTDEEATEVLQHFGMAEKPSDKKTTINPPESLKEILIQEIYNVLIGKNK